MYIYIYIYIYIYKAQNSMCRIKNHKFSVVFHNFLQCVCVDKALYKRFTYTTEIKI